jgi:hypothetical protein
MLSASQFHTPSTTFSSNCQLPHVLPAYSTRVRLLPDRYYFHNDQAEKDMQNDTNKRTYELHWMRHAERYLALVHAALQKNPDDLELQELREAMEAAVATRRPGPLH